jgi:hypothetical protein
LPDKIDILCSFPFFIPSPPFILMVGQRNMLLIFLFAC